MMNQRSIFWGLLATIVLALSSCATYVPNGPYSNDPQIANREYIVWGTIKPVRLDRVMLDRGVKNTLLELARKQFSSEVDDVIDIKSITMHGNTFLFLFGLPGRTIIEATAIQYKGPTAIQYQYKGKE